MDEWLSLLGFMDSTVDSEQKISRETRSVFYICTRFFARLYLQLQYCGITISNTVFRFQTTENELELCEYWAEKVPKNV